MTHFSAKLTWMNNRSPYSWIIIIFMNARSSSPNTQARQQIVAASHRLFLEQGYNGTSMRQIAKESHVALGSLYNHFSGKEQLFAAVFDAFNPYPILLLALENSQGATAEDLVHTAARRMVIALSARPDLVKLVFIDVVEFQGRHLQQAYPQVAARMQHFVQRLQLLSDDLRPIPAENLLRAFFGLFYTFHMTDMLIGSPTNPESQPAAVQDLAEIYLHGILKS